MNERTRRRLRLDRLDRLDEDDEDDAIERRGRHLSIDRVDRVGRDRDSIRSIARSLDSIARARDGRLSIVKRTFGTTAARAATRFCARAGLAASGINPVFNAKATMTACV